ncbi:PQQ-like beta-propeller repeat protein [Kitasatospora acidiphila]|uniref:PQQ-like beta-propeller repeat protein n=1 Tax=Kitasatospora acidiphila TaxID=2567942 RepID=A0A540W1V1_9ACTN|nr:PQQ-binding-like beta-propeller repeat protein [Kitasatospora acidiphila]TQF02981.1 PQQ-like beta-propeller repeat protein [Kitasatospora acidiphila]
MLLILGAGAAAHANRPVPFGDQVSAPGKAEASPVSAQSADPVTPDFRIGPGLEAYDPSTGSLLWSYRRDGATALHVSMLGQNGSPEQSAVVVWDDGMVTSLRVADHQVRWHRSVPGLSDWLHGDNDPGGAQRTDVQRKELELERAASAVQTVLGPEPWVQVLTPGLTMGFRDRDGDLRFNSRPQAGCLYDPQRAVSTDDAVLLPRACTGTTGSGRQLPGSVTGFKLIDHSFVLNTGPAVELIRLDGHRVRLNDGPLLGSRVVDADTGITEIPCGSASAPFAAEPAAGGCPSPAQQPTH